ncbi:hypothetical protein BC943DRAFT_315774 [Umbelopsis sp. AD052]|nr:hypothetical protein BC943DRAFT_315774 [Umbelopsis sp. AD052]
MDPIENQHTQAHTVKKNKKKKKPTASGEISQQCRDLLSAFPVELQNTRAKGRHAIASESLEPGTTVCREQATSYIVRSPYIDKQCHVCLNSLDHGDISHSFTCDACNRVYYCSEECRDHDRAMHDSMCIVINRLDGIASECSVDVDLLRLMLGLLARRAQVPQDGQTGTPTPFEYVLELVHNREKISSDFIQVITQASTMLNDILPEDMKMDVNELVLLACRINSNAHGLGDVQSRNTDSALGLFPLGAMFFNHSCEPNCNFVGLRDGKLEFRTLKKVVKGDELCVSYIDLFAPRNERRGNLLYTKQFWCKCRRCSTPMEKSVDRFLNGVMCRQCHKDVYVIPPAHIDGKTSVKDDESAATYSCAQCHHAAPHSLVAGTIERADHQYNQAIGMIRQRKYGRAKDMFNTLIKAQDNSKTGNFTLHNFNAILMNSCVPLMNCYVFEDNHMAAIHVNRQILSKLRDSGAVPENSPEIGDFLINLGELCLNVAKESHGKALVQERWKQEAETALKECVKLREIAFGPTHGKTIAAQKLLQSCQ